MKWMESTRSLSFKDIISVKDAALLIDVEPAWLYDLIREIELQLGKRKPDAFAHGLKIEHNYAKPITVESISEATERARRIVNTMNIRVLDSIEPGHMLAVSPYTEYKPIIIKNTGVE